MRHMEECKFRDLSDGAFFIEQEWSTGQLNLLETHEIYEKVGDRELLLVGSMVDGVARIGQNYGHPTADHISASSEVIFLSPSEVTRLETA